MDTIIKKISLTVPAKSGSIASTDWIDVRNYARLQIRTLATTDYGYIDGTPSVRMFVFSCLHPDFIESGEMKKEEFKMDSNQFYDLTKTLYHKFIRIEVVRGGLDYTHDTPYNVVLLGEMR